MYYHSYTNHSLSRDVGNGIGSLIGYAALGIGVIVWAVYRLMYQAPKWFLRLSNS